jgi:DNA replication protein DnaC
MINKLARTQILLLDDLGLSPMTDSERRDLLEVIEDRHGSASTIITSQLPIENWHEHIGDPTIADASPCRAGHFRNRNRLVGSFHQASHIISPSIYFR